jgi:hypothetical protein
MRVYDQGIILRTHPGDFGERDAEAEVGFQGDQDAIMVDHEYAYPYGTGGELRCCIVL